MANKSANPILIAGAIGMVCLLGVAWMFAAGTSNQAVDDAKEYAANLDKAPAKLAGGEVAATEEPKAGDTAEADEAKAAEEAKVAEAAKAVEEAKAAEAAEAAKAEEEAKAAEAAEAAKAEEETKAAEAAEAAKAEEEAKAAEAAEAAKAEEEAKAAEAAKAEEEAKAAAVAPPAPTETASVEGDVTAGKKVFRKCKACHKIGDGAKNAVGPHLNGIVGRKMGSIESFKYGDGFQAAMAEGKVWTPEELDAFLKKPRTYMPKTKMAFPGVRKDEQRTNLIAYLATLGE